MLVEIPVNSKFGTDKSDESEIFGTPLLIRTPLLGFSYFQSDNTSKNNPDS